MFCKQLAVKVHILVHCVLCHSQAQHSQQQLNAALEVSLLSIFNIEHPLIYRLFLKICTLVLALITA